LTTVKPSNDDRAGCGKIPRASSALLSEFASYPADNDARRTLVVEIGSIVLAKQATLDDVG
jgi:hypothetical protein